MLFFWVLVIAGVSIAWAFFAFFKEKNKKELEAAKEKMAQGRVIFHSSDVSGPSSS